MQILDHCTIFILIAGSYTPFTLCMFREYDAIIGWTMFGLIWGAAVLGIVLNAIVFRIDLLPKLLNTTGLILLVLGGVAYTIGAILYGVGVKHKYMHSVFHLFILLGTILQFFCIFFYVL